jgi:histidinol-phosphate/aromatic aminotransferase/cobyric acid decarboxylase-like protein/choline kinase
MKAVVLAAGAGARMRPLTRATHKSLLEAGGAPILTRMMDGLLGIGVTEIVVVTGYLREQVEEFLRARYAGAPLRFVHNPRFASTNNIVSLALAFEQSALDDDWALIECDVLFAPEMLRLLLDPEPGNLALVDHYRPGMDGTVVSLDRGVVTQVYPPHLQTEDFDYRDKYKTVNIYRFERDFCRSTFQPLLSCYAHAIDAGSYYELVLGMLINMGRQRVRAVVVDSRQWAEVDDPNDLAASRFRFEPERRTAILDEARGGYWNFDLLDFNYLRNMYFPPDAMLAAMRRALPELARNYGSSQPVLDRKLALALDCDSVRLLALNGASQVFPWLPGLFGAARVLLPSPTFHEFPRWFPRHTAYRNLAASFGAGDLVVVVNPNNPTGETWESAHLHALARAHPGARFLVDESFLPFSGQPSLVPLLEREPLANVLVVASLSKVWGVPGLRLGYVYTANPAWLAWLRARTPIWNMNALAEFFLELVLKFQPELRDSWRRTAADRAALAAQLAALPGVREVLSSGGNFLCFRVDTSAAVVAEALLREHLIDLKDVTGKFSDGRQYLRAAVRTPTDHARLLQALGPLLGRREAHA